MIFKFGILVLTVSIFYQLFFTNHFMYFVKKYLTLMESDDSFPRCYSNVFNEYDLENTKHLGILGHVFDVSDNAKMYGLNSSYNFFTGRDASRAFATGDFSSKGLTSDIQGLSDNEIGEIFQWLLYMNKHYVCIGHIPGLYFQIMGEYTEYMNNLIKAWIIMKERNENEEKLFPQCSLETVENMIKLFCPRSNGQLQTYPRKLRLSGTTKHRCSCLHLNFKDPRILFYDGCSFDSDTCFIPTK